MSHPDSLPTGDPTIGKKRIWGKVPPGDRLGVGVVGLHEGHTMLVALRASELCRVVAGCDLSEDKRMSAQSVVPGLRVTESFEEMLTWPEVDIVAIYTPDGLHATQIEAAFLAGKHVICTKPLINDPSVAKHLLSLANQTGMRLQVGQSTRFYEPFLRQSELFHMGEFGEVQSYDAHYNHNMAWYYKKSPWSIAETHWAYLGLSHPVDLIRLFLGEIASVQAVGMVSALGKEYGLTQPDIISVNMIAADGKIGRVFGNYAIAEIPKGRALIEGFLMGSHGSSLARYPELRHTWIGREGVEHDDSFDHALAGYYYRHELKGMHYGEFCNIADSFAAAILEGAPNAPDLEEGLQTVLVMAAIVEALITGETTKVRQL